MIEILDWLWRLAVAVWMSAAWGFAGYAFARWTLPTSGIALRWTAAAVVAIWLPSVAFHALLAVGLFTWPVGLVAALGAAAAAWRALDGHGAMERLLDDLERLRGALPPLDGRHAAHWLGLTLVLGIGLRGALVPVVAWDSMTYHAVKSALWIQAGGPFAFEAPGGFSIYRDYLGGGEALFAWAMLPLAADDLTGLLDAAIWMALGLAVHALGAQLGLGREARLVAVAYILTVPAVARASGSLYVDNLLAFALVASCALALHAMQKETARALVICGMAFGVALGVKIFALPVTAVSGVAIAGLALARRRDRATATALLAGAGALTAAAAPWFVGNWLRTGYPLTPLPVEIAGVTLGRANPSLLWYMDRPATVGAGPIDELVALGRAFGVPGLTSLAEPTLGAASLVVVLAAMIGFAGIARRRPAAAVTVAAFLLPMLVSYFGDGLRNTRLLWASVSGRYLLTALAIAVVLGLACCRSGSAWQRGLRGFMLVAGAAYVVATNLRGWTPAEWAAAFLGTGALLATVRLPLPRGRNALAAACACVLAATGALVAYRTATREHALRHSVVLHPSPRYYLPALPPLDDPTTPRRIAVTAGAVKDADNWLVYPFFGRRLQNELIYVPVTSNGEIVDLAENDRRVQQASYDAWLGRLREQRIDHVLSFSPQSLELVWMERNPDVFDRVAGDRRHWGLYRIPSR